MNLETLRGKLDTAKTGTGIVQVVFDYSSYLNHGTKTYPLALWDFDNIEGEANVSASTINDVEKLITINCWAINTVAPEADVVNRHNAWDTIEATMLKYLRAVNEDANLSIENLREMPFEYFPAGLLSLEREIAVRYRVELKLWCYTPPE